MSEHGIVTAPGTMRFERVLPGPIERIWAYLVESEKRGKWLAFGRMEPRVGAPVELSFRHSELSAEVEAPPEKYKAMEHGATTRGRITRFEPPRILGYTWDEGSKSGDSEVTFELSPRDDKVLLVLTHRRLADRTAMLSVAGGWHVHLDILADLLADRPPQPFWSKLARVEADYLQRLPVAG
jgi:uncharacterized protein YndB with AHSA1/START domain